MKTRYHMLSFHLRVGLIILLGGIAIFIILSCPKSTESIEKPIGSFQLKCPVVASDSMLPATNTCDGESASPPLLWSNAPADTRYFAVIMHHVAAPSDIHWYLVLYNIPATVNSLSKNSSGIGIYGTNSINDLCQYAPPCSQGPGLKNYIITIYALSDFILPSVPTGEVNREALLSAMEGKIISSAKLNVWYSRDVK